MQQLLSRKPLGSCSFPSSKLPWQLYSFSLKKILPLPLAIASWNYPQYLNTLFYMLPCTITPSFHSPLNTVFAQISLNTPLPLARPPAKAPMYTPLSEMRMPSLTGTMSLPYSQSCPSKQKLLVRTPQRSSPSLITQNPFLWSFQWLVEFYSLSYFWKISYPHSLMACLRRSDRVSLTTEQGTSISSSMM